MKYSLTFINNSTLFGAFCLFWTGEDQSMTIPLYSLAWQVEQCAPNARCFMEWNEELSLSWCETGALKPEVFFRASQIVPVESRNTNNNGRAFHWEQKTGYAFQTSPKSTPAGQIGIYTDASVPNDRAALGLGIFGSAAFACQAKTNFNYRFTLSRSLWAAFGDFSLGLTLEQFPDAKQRMARGSTDPFLVSFQPGVWSGTLTLKEDNTWKLD